MAHLHLCAWEERLKGWVGAEQASEEAQGSTDAKAVSLPQQAQRDSFVPFLFPIALIRVTCVQP